MKELAAYFQLSYFAIFRHRVDHSLQLEHLCLACREEFLETVVFIIQLQVLIRCVSLF